MYYANSAQNMFILPGRLRICIKGLNGDRKYAGGIQNYLSGMKGIKKITANPYTGNVLVFFNEEYIDIFTIEKLIHETKLKMNSAVTTTVQDSACIPTQKGNADIKNTNIKSVYGKLIPIVSILSLIAFVVSGNLLALLSTLVMLYPFIVYPSALLTLKSAAANTYLKGIIINNLSKLELALNTDTVVFSNTGLLTTGRYKVSNIIPEGRSSENRVLMLAASCGKKSNDPTAKVLMEEAANRNLELKYASNTSVCANQGISCMIDKKEVLVGNKKQLAARNLFTANNLANERKLRHLGQYPVFVAYNNKIIGIIGFRYTINKNCIPAIEEMRQVGIESIKIITEENEEMVRSIALETGIESFEANLKPESITEKIAKLKGEGRTIALIKDRLNDCTSKQTADISISVLNNSNGLTYEYSDFVIINGDLSLIPRLIELSKYTGEVISQNYIISLGLDAIGIILVLTGSISPYTALLYKLANSLFILLNARKPLKYKINEWAGG